MNEDGSGEVFGCPRCWPPSADDADTAVRALPRVTDLIDESHFDVTVRACPSCSQCFVTIFTEAIDWVDGEDPQYLTTLPITREEAAGLIEQKGALSESTLNALGPGRRSLCNDYPKGESPRTYWSFGISIGYHD